MDILSAIRQFSSPGAASSGAMPKLGELPGVNGLPLPKDLSKSFSPADLEKLAPDLGKIGDGASNRDVAGIGGSGSFDRVLNQLVSDVSSKSAASSEAVNGLITQQGVPLHQAMIAMEEASVSFQLMVEVRNKLLESYQELMRMQV